MLIFSHTISMNKGLSNTYSHLS